MVQPNDVTVKDVFRMVLSAMLSVFSMAPQTVAVIATNLDSLQKLSNAGNMLATDVESSAAFNHEINVIDLVTRKTKAQRAAEQALA
jgi:hypothetical protein